MIRPPPRSTLLPYTPLFRSNPSGQVVTSGTNAPNIQTFAVTATTSGTYRLVFEVSKANAFNPLSVSSLNSTSPSANTAPLHQRVQTKHSANHGADLYALAGQ